ncbi:MAG: T9SS type A sorting domain-containing protein [Saprospiraceae bacterium]|nr:T9SS type A sorting domain-containing protein [Saprospiraceae bacterium]
MKRRNPFGFTSRLSILKLALLFITVVSSQYSLEAQVDVTSSGGTPNASYLTLAAAFTAVNGGTHTGNITMNISANTTEPVGGAILNASGVGLANYANILIKPTGGASRVISGAITAGNPLVDLNGADNVTFDGLNSGGNALTIDNTTISPTSGTSTIRLQADATNNTFIRCNINGASTMAVGTNGGNFWFGASSTIAGNDNNLISNCKIGPSGVNFPTKGVYSNGTGTSVPLYNSNNTVTNCEIFDYFGVATQSAGIYITTASTNWTITNNKFYQTTTKTHTTGTIHAAIQLASANIVGCTITGNTVGFSNAAGAGLYSLVGVTTSSRMVGIYSSALGITEPTIISNNTIQNISLTGTWGSTTTTASFIGIQIASGWVNCTNNTVGSLDGSKTISITSPSASTSEMYGIYSSVSIAAVTDFKNNTIGSLTYTNTGTAACGIIGLRAGNNAGNLLNIENNTIGGVGGELKTVNNSVTASLNGNTVIGIYVQTSTHNIKGNVISNLTTNNQSTGTTTTASVQGIYISSAAPNSLITENKIHSLSNTSPAANSWVNGITVSTTTATVTFTKNFIHSLNITGTGTTATLNGIYISGGTSLFSNNMIRLGYTAAGASITSGLQINGIFESSGTNNIFFNSVYVGGSGVATLANNSFAFFSNAVTTARYYGNNIFYNARSNGASTGKHYAIKIAGTLPNPVGTTINFNDYFVDGTGGVLGQYNLVDQTTLAAWRTAVGQDCNSINSNPKFINPTGTSTTVDLHIVTIILTPIESAGLAIGLVTDDFDNQSRASLSPADIGADAGNFLLLDVSAPYIDYAALLGACGTGDVFLSPVTITDATGVPTSGTNRPRVYYRKNAGAWFSNPGILLTGTGLNGTWQFTMLAADMGGLVLGDIIDYYVIAQDLAVPINIVSNPCGAVATDVNTVSTPPPTLNSITVKNQMTGTFTVGIGGTYTTLTAAIADYNNRCLSGPVTFLLIDNSYPSETFPISINAITGQSSINTTTIKPAVGKTPVITGSSTTCIIRLNGADYIIIDGSNAGGSDRSLTFSNTSIAANTAVVCIQSLGLALGATNDKVKNCNIIGGSSTVSPIFGIHVAGQTISNSAQGADNDFLEFTNNAITKVYHGIYANGLTSISTGGNDNLSIIGNKIGPDVTGVDNIGFAGVWIANALNVSAIGNTIQNLSTTLGSSGGIYFSTNVDNFVISQNTLLNNTSSASSSGIAAFTSIFMGPQVINGAVVQNTIRSHYNTSTGGWGSRGIMANTANGNSNITIHNNMISDVVCYEDASNIYWPIGIAIEGSSGGINIYFNTINLFGDHPGFTSTAGSSACLFFNTSGTNVNVKNNILTNSYDNTTSTGDISYTIYTTGSNTTFASINNNDYYPSGLVGRLGFLTSDRTTIGQWQAATGQDQLSISIAPNYVSTLDLHLVPNASNLCFNQSAMVIPGITNDIDADTRNLTNPDMGADEFNPGTNLTIAITESSGTPNDKKICSGSSATITVTGGSTHDWNTGESTNAIVKSPASTTTYYDTVTLGAGCLVVMYDTIFVLPVPSASITPASVTICSGLSTTLTASGGGTYLWDNLSTNPVRTVTPGATTTYTVTVTAANGCTATATATVNVNLSPTAVITPAAPTLCSGATQTLTASGGTSYSWSTGANAATIMVSPGATTTYTVTVTAANACTATKTVTVTVITGINITETHVEPTTCVSFDGSINITATGIAPLSYSWSTPDGFGLNPSSEDQSGITVGTYIVTVTSGNGCTSTKSIILSGPGNCGQCPTIGALTSSVPSVCKSINFTLTASGLTNMGTLYGILFKYSTVALADPYVGGTTLGVVANGGLSGGGTSAVLITNIPIQNNYFIYAIVTPTPLSPACRPSASNTLNVYKCTPDITDPCACKNNATTLTNGQFNEIITVNAPSGQNWTVSAVTGLYLSSSPAPPAAPILIPIGTALLNGTIDGINNDGDGQIDEADENVFYTLRGVHVDALGYNVTVTNSLGTTASIGNTCYYPNPSIIGLPSVFCADDAAVTLVGNAQLGDGSGPAMGVGTFTINGVPATVFNPALLGAGTHSVVFSFDAADGIPNGSHPGCTQAVSQSVVVNPVPTVNLVASQILCVGQSSIAITFTGTPVGAVYNWTRTPELIGLVATSGSGSVPSFVGTNAGTTPLVSTFTVTPSFTNAGKTCFGTPRTFTITINPPPTSNPVPDVQYCHGDNTLAITFTGSAPGTIYNWTRTPEPIGLAATAGSNTVPSFVTTNPSAARITSTFTVTPVFTNPTGGPSCTGTPFTFRISVLPQPVARCKNATLYLDRNGNVVLTVPDIDNGSTARTLSLSKSVFNCGNVGANNVNLIAADSCGKTSTCTAIVTVVDTVRPTLFCPADNTIHLDPGECDRPISFVDPYATDNCELAVTTTTGSITTAFNSNNQFAGNMFNVTNLTTGPITLNSFAGNIAATIGTNCIVSIYHTPTTYVGKESNAAAWTLLGTGNAPCAGNNLPTLFNIGGLTLQPGETVGIYFDLVNYTAGSIVLRYTNNNITFNNGDLLLTLGAGKANPAFTGTTFTLRYWNGIINYTKQTIIGAKPVVTQIDNSGFKNGDILPRGQTCFTYRATDFNGNTSTCTFCFTLLEFQNPVTFLACHDEIQVSLNENCWATISADEILSGGPYGCYDDYIVVIRDWVTNQIIDRFPNIPGSQVGVQDINREFKITVTDPATGNSCWGHAVVEDKLAPVLTCARDTCVPCGSATTPFYVGTPGVQENCGGYSLTYKDVVTIGGCGTTYEELIERTWTAIDGQGNKAVCKQIITVALATLATVNVPFDFDDLDQPALLCNEKIDVNKDYTAHYLAFPYCVDGYLLDSAHWFATGGFLPSPNGDLAGERLPRVLGWNCLDTGLYIGHPSPWPIFYPAHPNWRPNNPVCWGPDEVIMWAGTGLPSGSECSNLGMTYNDIKINVAKPGCDAGPIGCYKIIRQWTVLDWCTGLIGGHNQIIKVIDKQGPEILYPDTVTVNMEVWRCLGVWEVPKPWLVDNCSNELHYSIRTPNGVVTGNEIDGYIIRDIERGISEATIYAEDCCGNITKKRIAINVPDNTPPIAVCDQKTIVSINGNQSQGENFAKVFAEDLDQGSFDNCSPHVFFKVIRMEQLRGTNNGSNANQPDNGTNCSGINGDDNAILDGNQIYFDDHVKFCCTDVGKTIMVVLRVFDIEPGKGPITPSRMNSNGNLFNHYSDCMIEIEVQDKSVPTVVPPPNIVVSCWYWFDVDKLTDPNDATFGRVVNDLTARKKVVTTDLVCYNYCVRNEITGYPGFVPGAPPSNPPAWNKACDYYRVLFDTAHEDRKYELVWGFDGTVLGSCGTNFSISVNDNRECGQGQLTRTIVARGPNGISVTATQLIWVVDCDPFYINRADNCDPDDDITWPGNCTGQATTINGCGADISPDNPVLGRPIIENNADDLCALISIEYFDEIFTIEPDACFKVLRTWVVIDWCQYDPSIDPVKGRWEYLQIIKVHDTDKPTISIFVGDCEPAVANSTNGICYGHMVLIASAFDNCSPLDWLSHDYKIDLYNDGIGDHSGFDLVVGPLTKREQAAGRNPIRHHNPYADDENNPFEATGTYPIGIHKICWYVEDGCGNLGAACQLFEIKDCKAPTPYCEVGIISVVMPINGCVTIWARDLDRGSFDNCTKSENLLLYFDGDPTQTSKTICCDDFVANGANDELIIPVQLWVEDEEGNTDYCRTTIVIQDPQNVCPDKKPAGKIIGALRTEGSQNAEKVDARLYQSGTMIKRMTTSQSGEYFFGDLNFGGSMEYLVQPIRSDEPLNGVSTADIVKIQRHILGIETLNSPYKLIAADVNNTNNITASDVSEIRKLILGITDKFAKNDSWTFIPNSYLFADPNNPWTAPRELLVKVPEAKSYQEDFVAVKIGDVTNNARANNVNSSSSRTKGQLHLEIENHNTLPGELYKLAFRSSDFENISGYQFTLKFDQQVLQFESIEAAALNVNESNFGTQNAANGILTTSWNTKVAQTVNPNEVLFTLVFRAHSKANIHKLIALTSDITTAEAYDAQLNHKELSLGVRTDNGVIESGIFELYQNTPNPFSKQTMINYRLPEASPVKLSVYDLSGKVLRVYEFVGQKGLNSMRLDRSDLNVSGVLYYQLDAANHTATKQMILLD